MKQTWILFILLWISFSTNAQHYPPEWIIYTSDGYVYDIQSEKNSKNLSESDFKNYLLNSARTNLAKQVQVQVRDVASLNKESVNGHTNITYKSESNFSTDVNLKLVETKSFYDSKSQTGYAIAYINRESARNYYKNELEIVYNKINNSLTLANNFVEAEFKTKAKSELEASLQHFASVDEPLFWMNIFGTKQAILIDFTERFNSLEQSIKQMLAELQHSTVIYLSCSANVFGTPYAKLGNELKGILATNGCSFTEKANEADWCITINCSTREYSTVSSGNSFFYFSYVDAQISIDKMHTSQRIYEDEINAKGGHTMGYSEAAKDAYKKIKEKIGEIILKNIQ